jgi:alkylhydroperoxidase family enzyme
VAQLDRAAAKELDVAGIHPLLRELIWVRASQLNGCAYCIDMRTGPRWQSKTDDYQLVLH